MSKRPHRPDSREEIEAALGRLRRALAAVPADGPAAGAYRDAIRERERQLAEIGEGRQ